MNGNNEPTGEELLKKYGVTPEAAKRIMKAYVSAVNGYVHYALAHYEDYCPDGSPSTDEDGFPIEDYDDYEPEDGEEIIRSTFSLEKETSAVQVFEKLISDGTDGYTYCLKALRASGADKDYDGRIM